MQFKAVSKEENDSLHAAVSVLRGSFDRGEDLTNFSTCTPETLAAWSLLRDFFRDRGGNVAAHFWEDKKRLCRWSDIDDVHIKPGAELIYKDHLRGCLDSLDWYIRDCSNTQYIKPGMTDREAVAAIVAAIIKNRKDDDAILTVIRHGSTPVDNSGNDIDDEPPLDVLQYDAEKRQPYIEYPVHIPGASNVYNYFFERCEYDYSRADVDRLTSAIIKEGLTDPYAPPEIPDAVNDDGDVIDLRALEFEIFEGVDYYLSPENNSYDYDDDIEIDCDGFYIEGYNLDENSEDLNGLLEAFEKARAAYAAQKKPFTATVFGRVKTTLEYDAEGNCTSHKDDGFAILDSADSHMLIEFDAE